MSLAARFRYTPRHVAPLTLSLLTPLATLSYVFLLFRKRKVYLLHSLHALKSY
jgi:hypothetical protein